MTSKSLWVDTEVAPGAEVLDGVHECDVAVIGSGIAGISTAYELSKRGKSVIVIDRGRICGGMTSRTSAHLAPLCDDLVSEMIKIKGKEATKLFCESQVAAVDRIEEIQKKEKIDCDFRRLDGFFSRSRGTSSSACQNRSLPEWQSSYHSRLLRYPRVDPIGNSGHRSGRLANAA